MNENQRFLTIDIEEIRTHHGDLPQAGKLHLALTRIGLLQAIVGDTGIEGVGPVLRREEVER
jgi:hypothetical protein